MSSLKISKHNFRNTVIISIVFVLALTTLTFRPHGHVSAATNGKIVFVTADDQENPQIFTSNADGSNLTQLTTGTLYPFNPKFSSDGTKIVYEADTNGDSEDQIYTMNADGSGQTAITSGDLSYSNPSWSPDGTKIAVNHSPDDINNYIYTMNADGSGLTQITTNVNGDSTPSWNPNGANLIYICYDGTHDQICTINVNGTNKQALTSDTNEHRSPHYSPDGTQIAAGVNNNPYDLHIVVMNANGSSPHTVVTTSTDTEDLSWSPDGTKLIFTDDSVSPTEITYVNATGGGDTVMTHGNDGAYNASWQPLVDSDGDGFLSTQEALGPNNGDSNGDGTPDKSQANVTNFMNSVTNTYDAVESNCTSNHAVSASGVPADHADKGFTYPDGLLYFALTCSTPGTTATVSLYFYGQTYSNTMVLRKYNTGTHTYQTVPGATISSMTIGGQTLTKATYQIKDGGPLDQDGTANGTIVDPVGITNQTVDAPNTGLGGTAL